MSLHELGGDVKSPPFFFPIAKKLGEMTRAVKEVAKMKTRVENLRKRMGAGGVAGSASPLSRGEITTIVRRFGYVVLKAHEIIISNLEGNGDQQLADEVEGALRPVVDWLLAFDVSRETTPAGDDTLTPAGDESEQ